VLGDVRHGSPDEEVDAFWRLEADCLERRRDDRADRREVLGQNHVLARLENAQLALERTRRSAQVRRRDHLEDELARRGDLPYERAERSHGPADAEVDGERAPYEEGVEAGTDSADPRKSEGPLSGHRATLLRPRLRRAAPRPAHDSRPSAPPARSARRRRERSREPGEPARRCRSNEAARGYASATRGAPGNARSARGVA
jgi:hypothetical protein